MEVKGSDIGKGVPKVWSYGYNPNAITSHKENKEGKKIKKKKKPAVVLLSFEPFTASQIVVTETYNPGAISKIVVGYSVKPRGKVILKTVWEGTATATAAKYTVRNFHFDSLPNISSVIISIDYSAIEGLNQLGGVCLVNSSKDYFPKINLPKREIFTEIVRRLNDDVNGVKNPNGLILSADGRYIYFSHLEKKWEQIFRAELDTSKEITQVVFSEFNLPKGKSKTCGLVGISQDNNIAYVSDMKLDKFQFYETYLGKTLFGKPKWKHEKMEIKGYKNGGIFIDYVMSYDGNTVILGYKEKSKHGDKYNEDLYVSTKDEKGRWSDFKHMGFDLNTLGSDAPCFLASDNKTLYFYSDGKLGYGKTDIYVSKRLDDTWQNWSEPVNLGPNINSREYENSFVIDPLSNRAYFVRSKSEELSDIYSIDLYIAPPKVLEPIKVPDPVMVVEDDTVEKVVLVIEPPIIEVEEEEILPEPVIIVKGVTTNKKTGEPIQAELIYYDIYTGVVLGKALSHAETGEYTLILRKGTYYSFESKAENFLSESQSLNTTDLTDFGTITKDFALSPIEKDVTIRLNNIFFDTDKAELLPASFLELDKLIALLNQNPKIKIEIGGHTDDVGSDAYNQKLSQRRAEAVRNYLISKGISESRITSKGYGESKPSHENNSPENRALNRRVEFTILSVE